MDIKCNQIQVKARLQADDSEPESVTSDAIENVENDVLAHEEKCECTPSSESLTEDDLARFSTNISDNLKRYVDLKLAQLVRQQRPYKL